MKKLLVALLALGLFGCTNKAVETTQTNNVAIPIETLFKHDGCTMYRFLDAGNFHYFAKCGNTSTVSHTSGNARGGSKHESIPTE